jgi:GT2 family glycosyltransferase
MSDIQVSIVIVNYNGRNLLGNCMGSLQNQSFKKVEIIFIDNMSADGSSGFVKDNLKNVIAVCNSENLGYAAAANQGIRLAKGKYVMIMNPDIIF